MFLHVFVILFTGGGGGLCPGGGVSIPGGLCPGRGVSVMETPRTVMDGRNASYWNAFLFY